MVQSGHFEQIYHFNETPIFDKVTISTIIFKFVKRKQETKKISVAKFYAHQKLTEETLYHLKNKIPFKEAEYVEVSQFQANERWLLQSDAVKTKLGFLEKICQKKQATSLLSLFDNKTEYHTIGEICDIGNGLVSGLDKAFQVNGHQLNEQEKNATINVLKAKDLKPFFAENITKYIFIQDDLEEREFKQRYPNFYLHFQKYKSDLEKRYQYNRKINYWEWVFLRNLNLFKKAEKRIFVPCKERISNKNHFRFALAESGIFPTQDVTAIFKKSDTKESIEYILAYLNQALVFDWLKCNGIVKGNIVEFSEKPIASIPFRKIDWNNPKEVALHQAITRQVQVFIIHKNQNLTFEISALFDQLFEICM